MADPYNIGLLQWFFHFQHIYKLSFILILNLFNFIDSFYTFKSKKDIDLLLITKMVASDKDN